MTFPPVPLRQRAIGIITAVVLSLLVIIVLAIPMKGEFARCYVGSCQGNLLQLSLGMRMYVQDWEVQVQVDKQTIDKGGFPLPDTWTTGLFPYVKNTQVFVCPSSHSRPTEPMHGPVIAPIVSDYGFNSALSGLPESQISNPTQTVLLFESSDGRAGRLRNVLRPGRHWTRGRFFSIPGNMYAFADGHTKFCYDETVAQENFIWMPTQPKRE